MVCTGIIMFSRCWNQKIHVKVQHFLFKHLKTVLFAMTYGSPEERTSNIYLSEGNMFEEAWSEVHVHVCMLF